MKREPEYGYTLTMSARRISALLAAFAFLGTPAGAQMTSTGQPTADDARKLQAVERYAGELSAKTAAGDERFTLADDIDTAWNSVSPAYIPLDTPATFPGGQAAPFTVMQERISVLNSTVADGYGFQASAAAVADWARRLLQRTSGER